MNIPPAGTGPSLERISLSAYGNDPINWRASLQVGGTPGVADTRPPLAAAATDVIDDGLELLGR